MIKTTQRLAASAAAIAVLTAPALAQDFNEDEIIVTATKRATTLQDTPVAVTVTSADVIQKAEIRDLLDLQSVVPSLRVDQLQASTQTNFIIRGFGNGANNAGIEPSVGVFVDGVYRSRSAAQLGNLPNLERVEVLAGPQSTLFGKNASAGVISIVTQAPQFDTEGYAEFGFGNFNLVQGSAYYTGPLSETTAFSLGGNFEKRGGYFDRAEGGAKLNDRDRISLRGQLLYEPTDGGSLRIIGEYGSIDELCCGTTTVVSSNVTNILNGIGGRNVTPPLSDPYSRVAFTDKVNENSLDDYGISAEINYDLNDDLSLTSITALRSNRSVVDIDADFGLLDLLDSNVTDVDVRTYTQELRLTSNFDSALNFQLGGFFFDEKVESDTDIGYGADLRAYLGTLAQGAFDVIEAFNPAIAPGELFGDQVLISETATQDDRTYSAFGTVDYEVTDRLTLTGGLNYTNVDKVVTLSQTNNDTFSNIDLGTDPGFAPIVANAIQGSFGADPTMDPIAGAFFQTFNIPLTAGNFQAIGPAGQGAFIAGLQPVVAAGSGLEGFQFQTRVLELPNAVEDGQKTDDKLTYTIRAGYEVSDDLSVYASLATGFKASSFNLSRDSRPFLSDAAALQARGILPTNYVPATGRNFSTRFAEPEEATVYEFGAKTRFGGGNTLNLAVFRQTLENFQGNAFVGSSFTLTNAGETRVDGVEVNGRLRPFEGLSIDYAGTYLDAEYTDYTNASGPVPGVTVDLTGTTPDNIAEFSGSLGMTYEWDWGDDNDAFIRGDFQYESPTTLATNLSLDNLAITAASRGGLGTTTGSVADYNDRSQQILNMSAGVGFGQGYSVQVWGRNVLGDDYISTLFPGVAQFGIVNGYPSAPATYGVNFRKEF